MKSLVTIIGLVLVVASCFLFVEVGKEKGTNVGGPIVFLFIGLGILWFITTSDAEDEERNLTAQKIFNNLAKGLYGKEVFTNLPGDWKIIRKEETPAEGYILVLLNEQDDNYSFIRVRVSKEIYDAVSV